MNVEDALMLAGLHTLSLCVVFEIYEWKMCVKYDTLYIKNYQL